MDNRYQTVINVSEYGATADSGQDCAKALNEVFAAAVKAAKPVCISFPTGRYDLYADHTERRPYSISNTTTVEQLPDSMRTVGLLLKDMSGVTIEGNGSSLLFHGRMTPLVFDHVTDIHMKALSIDFNRPLVSEITVTAIGGNYIEAEVHERSWYIVENAQLTWVGECGWKESQTDAWMAQQYDPATQTTWRSWNPVSNASSVEQLQGRTIKLNYSEKPDADCAVGHSYQIRSTVRYEVGALIYRSKNIQWEDINYYASPGLGIVGQYSENLSFIRLFFSPEANSRRVNTSMADQLHLSGCKGQINIIDSHFSGPQDDHINVHGTHLRIVEKIDGKQIMVRFCHNETWGFDAFSAGDTIDFIEGPSLLAFGSAVIVQASRVNDTEMILCLNKEVPLSVEINQFYVENTSWTPDVTISGCTFKTVPTRGVLVTTRGKVIIENNVFDRVPMSAILIADDSGNWFESGMVRDVTIRNNTFNMCSTPLSILPEAPCVHPEKTVHSNIVVKSNGFKGTDTITISVSGTKGFAFVDNTVDTNGLIMNFKASKDISIKENQFSSFTVQKEANFDSMYERENDVEENQGFSVNYENSIKN